MEGNNKERQINAHVYGNEKSLFVVHLVLSMIFWFLIILGTFGTALIYVLLFFVGYLFAQSGLISWIKGNGIKISEQQFPDLYERYLQSCQRLNMKDIPEAYILEGGGILNAFATRFLGRNFVVVYSDVIDAMNESPGSINFYFGHELAHIKRNHLTWGVVIWPSNILPWIGAAYSRAREYTCDQFGKLCCDDSLQALNGMLLLAAGGKHYKHVNIDVYLTQAKSTGKFWMAFHELIGDYPWLVKRACRLQDKDYKFPGRNPLAWLLALLVPRLGIGTGIIPLMIIVAIIGILAAIALPAYQDYTVRAATSQVYHVGAQAAELTQRHYNSYGNLPESLESLGIDQLYPSEVLNMNLNQDTGIIEVTLAQRAARGKSLLFVPTTNEYNETIWVCMSEDIKNSQLPSACRE
ncbi:M48 family metallopeptidase [Gilvimarinus sp. SDUM040013]|uniref:M48 family metallopeptidase n=1 Tax=Gilvimarinus gilvus TaxID=3058038 RepID=A0ABU4RZA4_9GAMM|nr:M48 family metallopeptidase [Gilvimarinus sp. SDUM040013]MDO3384630.1 M48 family metallopeptidase [Gilvimarinus sp. SDUM040013]MDX6850216.1 M48 family metallopeptidase [Gilvimarinus sp. SDUM040013]